MTKRLHYFGVSGSLVLACAGLAMAGTGDGSQSRKQIYAGCAVCDDYTADSTPSARSWNGTEKFGDVQSTGRATGGFAPLNAADHNGEHGTQEFNLGPGRITPLLPTKPTIPAPEPAPAAILGFDLLCVLGIVFLARRYRVQA